MNTRRAFLSTAGGAIAASALGVSRASGVQPSELETTTLMNQVIHGQELPDGRRLGGLRASPRFRFGEPYKWTADMVLVQRGPCAIDGTAYTEPVQHVTERKAHLAKAQPLTFGLEVFNRPPVVGTFAAGDAEREFLGDYQLRLSRMNDPVTTNADGRVVPNSLFEMTHLVRARSDPNYLAVSFGAARHDTWAVTSGPDVFTQVRNDYHLQDGPDGSAIARVNNVNQYQNWAAWQQAGAYDASRLGIDVCAIDPSGSAGTAAHNYLIRRVVEPTALLEGGESNIAAIEVVGTGINGSPILLVTGYDVRPGGRNNNNGDTHGQGRAVRQIGVVYDIDGAPGADGTPTGEGVLVVAPEVTSFPGDPEFREMAFSLTGLHRETTEHPNFPGDLYHPENDRKEGLPTRWKKVTNQRPDNEWGTFQTPVPYAMLEQIATGFDNNQAPRKGPVELLALGPRYAIAAVPR